MKNILKKDDVTALKKEERALRVNLALKKILTHRARKAKKGPWYTGGSSRTRRAWPKETGVHEG